MIIGIISIIIFIIGCRVSSDGDEYDNVMKILIGLLIMGLGLYFIFTFLGINQEIITNWFRI